MDLFFKVLACRAGFVLLLSALLGAILVVLPLGFFSLSTISILIKYTVVHRLPGFPLGPPVGIGPTCSTYRARHTRSKVLILIILLNSVCMQYSLCISMHGKFSNAAICTNTGQYGDIYTLMQLYRCTPPKMMHKKYGLVDTIPLVHCQIPVRLHI